MGARRQRRVRRRRSNGDDPDSALYWQLERTVERGTCGDRDRVAANDSRALDPPAARTSATIAAAHRLTGEFEAEAAPILRYLAEGATPADIAEAMWGVPKSGGRRSQAAHRRIHAAVSEFIRRAGAV